MGLLTRRTDEIRGSAQDWLTADDHDYGSTPSGVAVTAGAALGLTTIWRCWDLLTSAVAQAPKDVYLKVGGQSHEQFNKPFWLSTPNPLDPTYTANDYFAQVALSILADGNYFTAAYPDVYSARMLTLVTPSRITVRQENSRPVFDVLNARGQVTKTLSADQVLHGWWMRPPGELRGISPLEVLRRGISSAIAAEDYAGRYFGKGAALSFGVEVPTGMDKEKKKDFRASLQEQMAGRNNQHVIGVLTDGAKFVPGLAPTAEQAQMLATRKFSVEDLCRPYGVPPAMAGSTEPGAASFNSTESYDSWFKERAVLPLAVRIEAQHNRLLEVPLGVSDPSASMQFKLNLDAIARVNVLERAQAYGELVTKGVMVPNEARKKEDLPPLDGGDHLYMQQQMVPLGPQAVPDPRVTDLGGLIRAGFEPEDALRFLGLPPIKHTGLVPVTVQGENVATEAA